MLPKGSTGCTPPRLPHPSSSVVQADSAFSPALDPKLSFNSNEQQAQPLPLSAAVKDMTQQEQGCGSSSHHHSVHSTGC